MSSEIEHLIKARLWVARLGETDLYGWWGSDGVLGEDGGFVGPRVLPLTHGTGRARVSTAVARFACDERHPDRSARHLFRLDAAIEEQVDGFLAERLGDLTYWSDLLAKLEAVAHGADIAATLRDAGSALPRQESLDLRGITDAAFWGEAEGRIYETLDQYARTAANGKAFARRLFARDTAEGFAFIDVCRQRYDVVLMNPPFGEPSKRSKSYIVKAYPRTKNDLYAAFVERGVHWLHPGGLLGAITSRTGFFLTSFRKWREDVVLGEAKPTVVADLGYGVLDTAMVEVAAYCLEKSPGQQDVGRQR